MKIRLCFWSEIKHLISNFSILGDVPFVNKGIGQEIGKSFFTNLCSESNKFYRLVGMKNE